MKSCNPSLTKDFIGTFVKHQGGIQGIPVVEGSRGNRRGVDSPRVVVGTGNQVAGAAARRSPVGVAPLSLVVVGVAVARRR